MRRHEVGDVRFWQSDVLRRYSLDDLTTTFSEDTLPYGHKHRGRRVVLYDGEGDLDRNFEWWNLEKNRLSILPQLPFLKERTDVLTCQSKTDIAQSLNEIQELSVVAKTVDLEPHGREPVFDAPAILAERINFDRAVRVQHTEQILHGIGHGSSPLRAIAESW